MIDEIIITMVLLFILMLIISLPIMLVVSRRRKKTLENILDKCDKEKKALKMYIKTSMKKESFIRKLINESVFSFQPYILSFLQLMVDEKKISYSDLENYTKKSEAINIILKILLISFIIAGLSLMIVGLRSQLGN